MSWRRWFPFAALLASVTVLFHRLLLGEVIFWGVPLLQFYPWRSLAFDAFRMGRLPLWNPLVGNGAPLLANYQTAVFYPPNWLHLLVPDEHAMGWVSLLHVVWAGLGLAAYLHRLEVDPLGQGVGALSFALSGFIVARFGFLTTVATAAWLPWLMWAVDGVISPMGQPANRAAALAGVSAMLLLAGHAQMAFYSLGMAAAYAVWRALSSRVAYTTRIRFLAVALGAVVLGAALAAVQLAPTFELVRHSQRAGGVEYRAALSYSFWPWHFLTFLMPGAFGNPASGDYWGYGAYWEDAVYVGLLTLLLGGRALARWQRERRSGSPSRAAQEVPFLIVSLVPVSLLALGWNTPLFPWLFERIPTFNWFNGPARWMVLAVFALSALGGIGADRWQTHPPGARWGWRAVVAGLAFVLSAVAVRAALGASVRPGLVLATVRLGLLLALVGGLAILLVRAGHSPKWRAGWEALVLALLAADLVSAHWGLNPTIEAGYYHQRAALADAVPEGTRVLILPGDEHTAKFDLFLNFGDFRASDRARWDALRGSLLPNLNAVDGIPGAGNFDPLLVGDHAALLEQIDGLPPAGAVEQAARLNVGMLLTSAPLGGAELLGRAGPIYAYRVPDVWPRALLAACRPGEDGLMCERQAPGEAVIVADEPERVVVDISAGRAGWLVLVDTYYPGWQASLDGALVEIVRANGAFRAVAVPAGDHEVVFSYRPASLRIGAAISGAGLAVWLGLLVLSRLLSGRKVHHNAG